MRASLLSAVVLGSAAVVAIPASYPQQDQLMSTGAANSAKQVYDVDDNALLSSSWGGGKNTPEIPTPSIRDLDAAVLSDSISKIRSRAEGFSHASQGSLPNVTSLPGNLNTLSSCTLPCFEMAIKNSTCAHETGDELLACICWSEKVQGEMLGCAMVKCGILQTLSATNTTMTSCGVRPRDRTHQYTVITAVFVSLAALFTVLRIVVKVSYRLADFGMDDVMLLASMAGGVAWCVVNIVGMSAHGLGKDIWALHPQTVKTLLIYCYVSAFLYILITGFLKMSILGFYLRLFPRRSVRILLWSTFVFTILYMTGYGLFSLFQCQPVSYFWNAFDGQGKGRCHGNINVVLSHAGVGIGIDVWVLAVPLFLITGLNLDWKRKVGVGLMFVIGTLVTAVSICRLVALSKTSTSTNTSYVQWAPDTWATVEIYTGTICVSLPTIRVVLVHVSRMLSQRVTSLTKGDTYPSARADHYAIYADDHHFSATASVADADLAGSRKGSRTQVIAMGSRRTSTRRGGRGSGSRHGSGNYGSRSGLTGLASDLASYGRSGSRSGSRNGDRPADRSANSGCSQGNLVPDGFGFGDGDKEGIMLSREYRISEDTRPEAEAEAMNGGEVQGSAALDRVGGTEVQHGQSDSSDSVPLQEVKGFGNRTFFL